MKRGTNLLSCWCQKAPDDNIHLTALFPHINCKVRRSPDTEKVTLWEQNILHLSCSVLVLKFSSVNVSVLVSWLPYLSVLLSCFSPSHLIYTSFNLVSAFLIVKTFGCTLNVFEEMNESMLTRLCALQPLFQPISLPEVVS